MTSNFVNELGDFAVFGFTQNPSSSIPQKLRDWGIPLKTVDFGQTGQFYFHTTYGDIEETEELLCLKLGFTRTPGISSLSAKDLIDQKLLSSSQVHSDNIRGNALLTCLSKTDPELLVYQTIFTPQQLYYIKMSEGLLCSTNQRCLIYALDSVEFNDDILPYHFLFQLLPGPLTYYRDVHRLFPGERLHWKNDNLDIKQVKSLRLNENGQIDQVRDQNPDLAYETIKSVVHFYLDDLEKAGHQLNNLLSGGVDSGILQVAINEKASTTKPVSFSYQVHVPGFGFEAEYAREASNLLGTDHTIADIYPEDFPDMIGRAIEAVAQPIPGEADACKIMIAEFLAQQDTPRYFFSGQVADALYGMGLARKVAVFNLFQKIPAAEFSLKSTASIMKMGSARLADGLSQVATTISAMKDPKSYQYWPNSICTYVNLPIAQRSFGDEALQKALAYRVSLEKQYLGSKDLAEQLHTIDMLTEGYEPAMFGTQMFLTKKKEQIYPYLDEDVIRNAYSFSPRVRYLKPGFGFMDQNNTKYLLKNALVKKSYGDIALKKKGASAFDKDLFHMMKKGALKDAVDDIERPGFLSQTDLDALRKKPDHFLWNLLTYDIFKKRVLKSLQQP